MEKQFKVAVSTGIYHATRDVSLASDLRKVGYGLTKGVDTMEVALDIPQEVQYTDSKVEFCKPI